MEQQKKREMRRRRRKKKKWMREAKRKEEWEVCVSAMVVCLFLSQVNVEMSSQAVTDCEEGSVCMMEIHAGMVLKVVMQVDLCVGVKMLMMMM